MIEFDTDIPLPSPRAKNRRSTLRKMRPGYSFFFNDKRYINSARDMMHQNLSAWKFVVQKETKDSIEGWRIFCTNEILNPDLIPEDYHAPEK